MRFRRTLPSLALVFALPFLSACGGEQFVAGAGTPEAGAPDAGGPFCPTQSGTDFSCSDFDEKPLPENWNALLTKPGSVAVAEDDAASVSPPNSLLAMAPALGPGAAATESFVSATALPAGGVHIALDVRIDALSFPNNATGAAVVPLLYTQRNYEVLLAFVPSTTGPFDFFLVELAPGPVTALDAGSTSTPHDLTALFAQPDDAGPSLGSWQHLELALNIDKGDKSATVTVGSRSIVVSLNPPVGTANGNRTFSIGVQATPPTGPTKIRFDNVTYSAN